ncbi:DUF421 domain-containing protein [Desulfitobacterium sp. Sab5]|uniref:DUF421 domain-containing protein n=1 Tax=Desulfitobacterium nosdiversum TaxID=3375356 RepID=UPI003CE682FD
MFEPFNILLRIVLAVTLLLLATKLLTKRSLSNLTYFDYTAGALLGTISGNLAFNLKISISNFILSIAGTTFILVLFSYFSFKFKPIRKILAGEPTLLIKNGKILENTLQKLNYSFDYLMQQLRQENVFDLSKVEFAILEPSGELSILLKSQYNPLTPQDLNITTHYEGLVTEVILDGKILMNNLTQRNLNSEWLYKELRKKGVMKIEDIVFAAVASNGNLYLDLYQDKV